MGIIQRLERLEGDEHDRNVHFAHDRAERGAGGVGEHVDEEDVQIGRLDCRQRLEGAPGVVDHAEGDDFNLTGGEFSFQDPHLLHQLIEQPGELFPVGVQTDSHQSGACGKRFPA